MTTRGGRIAPDGRPPQAKGVGKNAKRHDLERQKTPGLHGSDLQQGDVQAMEQGQRIAPAQKQERGQAPRTSEGGQTAPVASSTAGVELPDAIEFLGGRQGTEFNVPQTGRRLDNSKATTWLPILQRMAAGPGSSGALARAVIAQSRDLRQAGASPAIIINTNGVDDAIETMTERL